MMFVSKSSQYKVCIKALKLQSRTLNLGHTALVPALMLVSNGFLVELSNFEANIEREREKDVEYSMLRLFLQLTQILMS